jgi:hypothetical protein
MLYERSRLDADYSGAVTEAKAVLGHFSCLVMKGVVT